MVNERPTSLANWKLPHKSNFYSLPSRAGGLSGLIIDGLWGATRSNVNVFAVQKSDGFTLIDTGSPDFAPLIMEAIAPLGSITDIIVTHAHADHAGSLKALVDGSGARAWMHSADATLVEKGISMRPYKPSPTLFGQFMTRLLLSGEDPTIPAVSEVGHVEDGEVIEPAGGFEVFHMPGHCEGQIALGWSSATGEHVLFAADVCANVFGPSESIIYENREIGLRSIKRLAELARSADLMVFGHGKPLINPAKRLQRFANKFRIA
ncbi:MAG: MBL fold metallo-hydrolase [Chloroflexota bacterium]